ncbi:MAG: B12-binding domain-containing radical SAM protein [Myxococcota bacterium]|nr:B12-binding domain-containing radical SAM protein [Myxococcota bacterium]MDW8363156.1 radical SAM protein [Myxococcales bacterium]
MRVLFVAFSKPWTPFNSSVAALAGVVRAAGHEPVALALPLDVGPTQGAWFAATLRPDLVCVTAMTRDAPVARALLPLLRARTGAPVVVGGYHATFSPRDFAVLDGVDAIGIGEGERALRALLDDLVRGTMRTRPGLWVRGPRGFEGEPPPPDPEPDIAALPPWDYEALGDVRAMLDHGINTLGPVQDRYLPLRASRGCPYGCAYCSAPSWNGLHRNGWRRNVLPVEQLCDEAARLRDRWHPDGFEMWDEHFPIDERWLRELATRWPERVGLPFRIEWHPAAASRERLRLVREAGCELVHVGVEVGDPELRRRTLLRRQSDELLERVFADARALGLATSASVMVGVPGERADQVERTVALLERLRPDSFMWSNYTPLPGTALARARADGAVGPDAPPEHELKPEERSRLHGRLAELSTRLAGASPRPRRIDAPKTAASASGLDGTPSETLRRALEPAGRRIETARWEGRTLLLEIALSDGSMRRVRLGPADGSPAYRVCGPLRLAYDGERLDDELRAILDAWSRAIEGWTLERLRVLQPGDDRWVPPS